ncbi:MAG TPA: ATP-binding protein [bacterium]
MNRITEPVLTVLVVDDDEYILELLKAFFEQTGMRVFTAANAEDALALPRLEQVHVALLDVQMPGANGHDLQKELNRRFPDMAKILMSGQADLDDVIAGFADQAFSFVQKPFSSLKEIAVLVRRAAQHKELEIRNREYAHRLEESNQALAERLAEQGEGVRLRDIMSHLYFAAPQIAKLETADAVLEYICRALVDAGAFERAAMVISDEKFIVRHAGMWQAELTDAQRNAMQALEGQPLRPVEFDRVEERVGSAIYAPRRSERMDVTFVPLFRQDGALLGYLTVESAAGSERPSLDLVRMVETLLAHAAQQLAANQLRLTLARRTDEAETHAAKAAADLQTTAERFNQLVNASTDIVYLADEQDRLTFLNDSFTRVLGYVRDNYIGRTLRRLLEDLVTENPINRRAIEELTSADSDQPVHYVEVLTREGDKRTLMIHRSVIRQGEIRKGSQGVARDITENRALLQQLVTSERLATTGKIAAGVAHEIKNPLQAMLSQLKTVEQKIATNEDPAENLELIQESVERLRHIVGSMLDLNRTAPAARMPVSLNSLVQKVIALLQQQIREHNVQVHLELAQDLPSVAGSAQELQQVILNLTLNAIEAMPNGGDLTITSAAKDDRVELNVQDSGVGIAPEHVAQIFEPFFTFRVSGTGTGLGLYLTKNIIEMHQGTIAVESAQSQGARFTVSLPAA